MTTTDLYLAVFRGGKDSAQFKAWLALPEAERKKREREGMQAWGAWMHKHAAAVVQTPGGPLGKTKRVSPQGVADISNDLGGFTVVRASSHDEAAKMFENHPHFAIFPGEHVDVMPVLSMPGT